MNRSKEVITQYLLGELPEADASAVEQEYFADPQFFDQVVDAENELVDEYARRQLSPRMRERFETYYLTHHARRDRAKFAAALTERLDQRRRLTGTSDRTESWWGRLFAPTNRPRLALGFALALLLIVGVIWLAIKTREPAAPTQPVSQTQVAVEPTHQDQVASETDRQRDEPKAAQPSPTPQGQKAPAMATLILNITTVRGAETGPPVTLVIAPGAEQARIQLNLSDNDYARYSVVIKSADGKARASLSVIVPANQLANGDYILTLKGSTQSGEVEDVNKSLFRVSRRTTINH
jgi:hypothetical protein